MICQRLFRQAVVLLRVVKGEKLTEAPPQPPLETEVEETPPEDPSSCLQEMLEGISRTNRASLATRCVSFRC